jgi:hypothetical protein
MAKVRAERVCTRCDLFPELKTFAAATKAQRVRNSNGKTLCQGASSGLILVFFMRVIVKYRSTQAIHSSVLFSRKHLGDDRVVFASVEVVILFFFGEFPVPCHIHNGDLPESILQGCRNVTPLTIVSQFTKRNELTIKPSKADCATPAAPTRWSQSPSPCAKAVST